jgi:membrane protease YdiL (CAAX protease family)
MEDPNAPFTSLYSPKPPAHSDRAVFSEVFWGPNGLRAGWRLLIFFAILRALAWFEMLISRFILHRHVHESGLTAESALRGEGGAFALVLIAIWIVAKIENRTIGDYGLPWQRAFCGQFWQGLLIGFASITALLGSMWAAGVFHFGSIALRGVELWKYAALWGLAFLFVALFEEIFFRGYALFTLTTGIGFWPAAILCSVVFGYVHHSNQGETWVGAFAAGVVGLVFCILLRRTGDLWMPIGFHMSWDWGETYFYGVPDSGQVATGHLLNATFTGPQWLTGGTVGPEGSWLCILVLVLLGLIFAVWLPDVKYPSPAALARAGSTNDAGDIAVSDKASGTENQGLIT